MKKAIHPKIYTETVVKCACGNTFTTISTLPSIQVDICSNCHPLFTGQHKFVDTEGRIDKFNKKAKTIQEKKESTKKTDKAKKETVVTQETVAAKNQASLKDLLKQLRDEEEKLEKTEDKKTVEEPKA